MKRLYESLLDDDDILFKNTDKNVAFNIYKQNIINFINENYYILNKNGNKLKIERYLKINKDFTVDIKTLPTQGHTITLHVNVRKSHAGVMPVQNFTWGKVDRLDLFCGNATEIKGLPKECNSVIINGGVHGKFVDSHVLDNLNMKVHNYMELWNLGVKHINDLNIGDEVGTIYFYSFDQLESIKTLPKNIGELHFFDCPKLNSLGKSKVNYLSCFKTDLSEEEIDNKIDYKSKHVSK